MRIDAPPGPHPGSTMTQLADDATIARDAMVSQKARRIRLDLVNEGLDDAARAAAQREASATCPSWPSRRRSARGTVVWPTGNASRKDCHQPVVSVFQDG